MKKVLLIVGLSFLLASNSFAGCRDDISFSWHKPSSHIGKVVFEFKNKGSKHIRITSIAVSDADRDKILEFSPTGYNYSNSGSKGVFVRPNGSNETSRNNWNAYNYGRGASWKCSYQKPYETSIGDKADNATGAVGDFFGDLFKKDK